MGTLVNEGGEEQKSHRMQMLASDLKLGFGLRAYSPFFDIRKPLLNFEDTETAITGTSIKNCFHSRELPGFKRIIV
jgi:hypothetical protein